MEITVSEVKVETLSLTFGKNKQKYNLFIAMIAIIDSLQIYLNSFEI
jgi:hypothetical protein